MRNVEVAVSAAVRTLVLDLVPSGRIRKWGKSGLRCEDFEGLRLLGFLAKNVIKTVDAIGLKKIGKSRGYDDLAIEGCEHVTPGRFEWGEDSRPNPTCTRYTVGTSMVERVARPMGGPSEEI